MTQFSDQLDKQTLINLARNKYDVAQRSKLPSVVVKLTSGGKIYPESHPLRSGTIEMRHMTAYDEDILTNVSYIREAILFDKLLEAIIVSPIDIADISPVDKDGLIVNARILAYGSDYPVQVTDPKTGVSLNRIIDLKNIQPTPFELQSDANGEFSYELSPTRHIKFSYQHFEIKDDTKISDLLQNIITQVGDTRKSEDIENFIRYEFLAGDAKQFRNYVGKHKPTLDLTYEFEGEAGDTFRAGFQLGTNLFWF